MAIRIKIKYRGLDEDDPDYNSIKLSDQQVITKDNGHKSLNLKQLMMLCLNDHGDVGVKVC